MTQQRPGEVPFEEPAGEPPQSRVRFGSPVPVNHHRPHPNRKKPPLRQSVPTFQIVEETGPAV